MAKVIPGLRPWEVLSVEQAMDQLTYGGEWYREPLGSFTTGPPYIEEWNRDVMVSSCFRVINVNFLVSGNRTCFILRSQDCFKGILPHNAGNIVSFC